MNRMLRPREVAALLGIGRTTLWRWQRDGKLPAPRRLGENTIAWAEEELDEWLAARPFVGAADDA